MIELVLELLITGAIVIVDKYVVCVKPTGQVDSVGAGLGLTVMVDK